MGLSMASLGNCTGLNRLSILIPAEIKSYLSKTEIREIEGEDYSEFDSDEDYSDSDMDSDNSDEEMEVDDAALARKEKQTREYRSARAELHKLRG